LIEAMTWRWGPHSMRANLREPRSDEAMQAWRARDPIFLMDRRMEQEDISVREQATTIRRVVKRELDDAIAFAENSPEPDIDILQKAVNAPRVQIPEPANDATRELSYSRR